MLTAEEVAAIRRLPRDLNWFDWWNKNGQDEFNKATTECGVKDPEALRTKFLFLLSKRWVNQPSTLQPYHKHHGQNVLCDDTGEEFVQIWFLDRDAVVTTVIDRTALASGWQL